MSALHTAPRQTAPGSTGTTLLALVQRLTDDGVHEDVVVERALELLESGRAHLTGNCRDVPVHVFRS
jgi:hypothetical protein